MKSQWFLALTALLSSGCAQVSGQFYTKKGFTSKSFAADSSECKRQNPSFVAIRGAANNKDGASYVDDATVRDCMKAKGYNIQLEMR